MKKKKNIKQLLEQKKANDLASIKLSRSNNVLKDTIIKDVNPILKIMNSVEKDVLNSTREAMKKYTPGILFPIPHRIDVIYKVSQSSTLLKLKENRCSCGEWYIKSYKIPLTYFNLNENEIRLEHTKWCEEYMVKKIEKIKTSNIKYNEEKIAELKKQIEKYEN